MAVPARHWDAVYAAKATDDVSWFQADPVVSLRLLAKWASPSGSVVDIGAGTSTLVDSLLDKGWTDVTVLDVSEQALNKVRDRLGSRAGAVRIVAGDVRSWRPSRTFDAWHDRATFHFLVDGPDRDGYVALAGAAVAPGGVVVLATFAADGPTACSGLPTARYDADELSRLFSPAFVLEHAEREEHTTPWGAGQWFTWVVLRRTPGRGAS
ncbi:MAG: class I SAM-dependent methyltransferase [Acidimicrobiales bacterium]